MLLDGLGKPQTVISNRLSAANERWDGGLTFLVHTSQFTVCVWPKGEIDDIFLCH